MKKLILLLLVLLALPVAGQERQREAAERREIAESRSYLARYRYWAKTTTQFRYGRRVDPIEDAIDRMEINLNDREMEAARREESRVNFWEPVWEKKPMKLRRKRGNPRRPR